MKRIFLYLGVIGILVGAALPVFSANTASAANFKTGDDCTASFLTFPAWYRGLPRKGSSCDIAPPSSGTGATLSSFIFTIILNIIEIALQLVAYAAVGYVIYGGFKYLTAAGDASRITSGRKSITNALVGLVISFMSIGIVNLVAGNIQGSGSAQVGGSSIGIPVVEASGALGGILTTVYYAAGIVAVVVIIVSAFFYVTSQGDAGKIKRAKDGILYSVVGLVVVMVAFVITNFIIGRF